MRSHNVVVRIELDPTLVDPLRAALLGRGHNTLTSWVRALIAAYLVRNQEELSVELGEAWEASLLQAEQILQSNLDTGVEGR